MKDNKLISIIIIAIILTLSSCTDYVNDEWTVNKIEEDEDGVYYFIVPTNKEVDGIMWIQSDKIFSVGDTLTLTH